MASDEEPDSEYEQQHDWHGYTERKLREMGSRMRNTAFDQLQPQQEVTPSEPSEPESSLEWNTNKEREREAHAKSKVVKSTTNPEGQATSTQEHNDHEPDETLHQHAPIHVVNQFYKSTEGVTHPEHTFPSDVADSDVTMPSPDESELHSSSIADTSEQHFSSETDPTPSESVESLGFGTAPESEYGSVRLPQPLSDYDSVPFGGRKPRRDPTFKAKGIKPSSQEPRITRSVAAIRRSDERRSRRPQEGFISPSSGSDMSEVPFVPLPQEDQPPMRSAPSPSSRMAIRRRKPPYDWNKWVDTDMDEVNIAANQQPRMERLKTRKKAATAEEVAAFRRSTAASAGEQPILYTEGERQRAREVVKNLSWRLFKDKTSKSWRDSPEKIRKLLELGERLAARNFISKEDWEIAKHEVNRILVWATNKK